MDFTDYPLSDTYFGGSERKTGIMINHHEYMLKFRKKTPFDIRNNHFCEYLGSHIFEILGFATQETFLGKYKGEEVVACKNFIPEDSQFVPFNDVGESTLDQDREKYQYAYDDIMQMLRDNSKLTNVNETISLFWRTYVVDALIGNFDRHGGNWGFIKKNNRYTAAPIFDNGSCLFPKIVDEEQINEIMNSRAETEKRIFMFPTSQIRLDNHKSSYYEVISSLKFKECNDALCYVVEKISLNEIEDMIQNAPYISETQKGFYIYMIKERYEKILKDSYHKLKGKFI